MSNTAGTTWDVGTVPYIPAPMQWGKRHKAFHDAREKWDLCGLMEGHHYGFSPSIISELSKWSYWSPVIPANEILNKIAIRDFGSDGAEYAFEAWKFWSEASNYFMPTNEDQYGPCRVEPSYPLIFHSDITRTFLSQEIEMPAHPDAPMGNRIVKTFYRPFENEQQSPGILRFPVEIKTLRKMLKIWNSGIAAMEKAVDKAPAPRKDMAQKMLCLGKYIAASVLTTIHLKEWWLLNKKTLA